MSRPRDITLADRPPPVGRSVSNGWPAVFLFAATILAYAPALRAGFIWDDSEHVTAPALRSLAGLWRIWFEVGATQQYYPLLHSAFWLEHRLWGDAPLGYHLANVLLHAGASCLLAAVLSRLAVPGAWLAAFLFALHPVAVESVAWIAEQKNTLSLVWYLFATLFYLRFDGDRHPRNYAVASACFVLALLTKSVTATLPAALLVVFWWRRGWIDVKRDLVPLTPWFAAGAAMGLFSAFVERNYLGAQGVEYALTSLQRVLLAGRVVWFYVDKLVWPANLIFFYPRWEISAATTVAYLFPAALAALLAGLWSSRGHARGPLAAMLFFVGSLFPVLGFFNVYPFVYSFVADHWQYLPSLGLMALAAAGLRGGLVRLPAVVRLGAPALVVGACALLTFRQTEMYADMPTFYSATLARNPGCWMAHNNLGNLLRAAGRPDDAIAHFKAALALRPDLAKAHYNLANALRDERRAAEALPHYARAVELTPDDAEAQSQYGNALRENGRTDDAIAHLLTALRLDPGNLDARNNLGVALRAAGRLTAAAAEFERVLRADPSLAYAHLNLALTYSLLNRMPEAMEQFQIARRLNPTIPDVFGR